MYFCVYFPIDISLLIGNVSRAPIETRNEVDGQSGTRVVTISCQFRAPEKERTREIKKKKTPAVVPMRYLTTE